RRTFRPVLITIQCYHRTRRSLFGLSIIQPLSLNCLLLCSCVRNSLHNKVGVSQVATICLLSQPAAFPGHHKLTRAHPATASQLRPEALCRTIFATPIWLLNSCGGLKDSSQLSWWLIDQPTNRHT